MKIQEAVWRRGLVGLILLIFLWPYLSHPFELPYSLSSDLLRHYLPFKSVLHGAFVAFGGIPEWDPHTLGGHPLAADPGYGAFYPLGLPFYFFPPERVFTLFFVGHILLGCWLADRLILRLGARKEVAAMGAIAYGLNLKMVGTLYAGFATMIPAQAWLPGVFLGAQWFKQAMNTRDRLLATAGMGGALAMQILAGDAQLAAYSALFLAPYLLFIPAGPSDRKPSKRLALAGLFGALFVAVALAWPMIGMAMELTEESTRAQGVPFAISTLMSVPPSHLPAMVFPALSGFDGNLTYRGPSSFWEMSFYPGILVWLLAMASVTRYRADRRILPLAFLAYVTLLLAFGSHAPVYPVLYYLVPGFDHFRGPARVLPLLALWLPLLAALCLHRLTTEGDDVLRRTLHWLSVLGILVCLALALYLSLNRTELKGVFQQMGQSIRPNPGAGPMAYHQLLLGFGMAGVILFAFNRWLHLLGGSTVRRAGLTLAILALLGIDLLFSSRGVLRTRPIDDVFPPNAAATALTDSTRHRPPDPPGRVLDLAGVITDAVAVHHDLQRVGGLNPLILERLYRYARYIQGEPPEIPTDRSVYGALIFEVKRPRLLDLMRVSNLLSVEALDLPGYQQMEQYADIRVFHQFRGIATFPRVLRYHRIARLPSAWVVNAVRRAPSSPAEALELLEVHDPFRGALLEKRPEGPHIPAPLLERHWPRRSLEALAAPDTGATEATVIRWSPEEIVLDAEGPTGGGLLVLSEIYTRGWRVTVDGEATTPWCADFLLRGVLIGEGLRRVVWKYEP